MNRLQLGLAWTTRVQFSKYNVSGIILSTMVTATGQENKCVKVGLMHMRVAIPFTQWMATILHNQKWDETNVHLTLKDLVWLTCQVKLQAYSTPAKHIVKRPWLIMLAYTLKGKQYNSPTLLCLSRWQKVVFSVVPCTKPFMTDLTISDSVSLPSKTLIHLDVNLQQSHS